MMNIVAKIIVAKTFQNYVETTKYFGFAFTAIHIHTNMNPYHIDSPGIVKFEDVDQVSQLCGKINIYFQGGFPCLLPRFPLPSPPVSFPVSSFFPCLLPKVAFPALFNRWLSLPSSQVGFPALFPGGFPLPSPRWLHLSSFNRWLSLLSCQVASPVFFSGSFPCPIPRGIRRRKAGICFISV